jgi:two-component SAPR family response regulator
MNEPTEDNKDQNHLALFYSKEKSLWAQCAALYSAIQPTSWLYISDEHDIETVAESLTKHEISLKEGEIILSEAFNYRQQVVRIPAIIEALKNKIKPLKATHRKGVLLFIEMTWTVRTPSGAIYLREYESAIHQLADEMEVSICCLYNEAIILDDQLMTAIQTHPVIVTREGIKENPHFLPPAIFVKRNQRRQFNYWLEKIDSTIDTSATLLEEEKNSPTKMSSGEREMNSYNIDSLAILIAPNSDEGRWKIRCFGELKVYRENGDIVDWNTKGGSTRKLKTLFAYLLFKGGKGASIEELVDMLWADTLDLKISANRLYHSIRFLRKILSPNLDPKTKSPFILNRDNKYFLAVPTDTWVDLPMFQELCFKGNAHLRNGDLKSALIAYQSAERLYQGDLLAGVPSKYIENLEHDWCWSRRYWFRDMNHKLLYEIASIHRMNGNTSEALSYCDKAIAVEPSSERAHQEKMKTFSAAGRTDALNRQYRLYCKALKQFDLGEPSLSTRKLFENLAIQE